MLHGLRWSYFNNFHIKKIGPFKFACGIGIYLGRSVAAIASHAQFVALKAVPAAVDAAITTGPDLYIIRIWQGPKVIKPTKLFRDGLTINYIEDTPMWDELIIPEEHKSGGDV